MYFLALATDYDGTIAHHGVVPPATVEAMQRLKDTGRRLILVTGREMPDLRKVFPQVELFDRIVAENGALIVDPATGDERVIAPGPPPEFVAMLEARGVGPISVGRAIVATWEPHQNTVLEVIRELDLELQIIFNKGAVMVLPAGINKAVGLAAALVELDLTAHNVVAVGDAENDHAFLRACGCAAAVANALPSVKDEADVRLGADHGAGVVELIERICCEDGALVAPQRHGLLVGHDRDGTPVYLEPHGGGVLIAGKSGIGKSTLVTALTERMVEMVLEFCILDPEGEYDSLRNVVSIGADADGPSADEVMELVEKRAGNVVIETRALATAERLDFFAQLLPRIASLRARTGRPHWLIVGAAHHLLAASRDDVAELLPESMGGTVFITAHPENVAASALESVRYVIAFGAAAQGLLDAFCAAAGAPAVRGASSPADDEVWFVDRMSGQPPRPITPIRPEQQHKRHTRN
ncbi:MAG: HAD-IIB family hydrolase [Casimicrobiaceae bacterium]